jgi:hypothetical protein
METGWSEEPAEIEGVSSPVSVLALAALSEASALSGLSGPPVVMAGRSEECAPTLTVEVAEFPVFEHPAISAMMNVAIRRKAGFLVGVMKIHSFS